MKKTIVTTVGVVALGVLLSTGAHAQSKKESISDVEKSVQFAQNWLDKKLDNYHVPKISYTGEPITIRLSSHLPEASARGKFLKQAFDVLEHMSGGKLVVKPRWSGAVHSVREGFEANRSGITDFSACFVFLNSSNFPLASGLELPGIFPNPEILSLVAEELAAKYFEPEFEKQGVYLQSITSATQSNLFSIKPLLSVADLEGKKVRSGTGISREIFEAVGAVPVNMSSKDIFSALQRGLLDAIYTSDASARTFKLDEVAKHHLSTPINYLTFEWCMNPRFYDALPADLRAVFDVWSRQKSQVETQISFTLGSAESREQFTKEGMQYNDLDEAEFAKWQAKFGPIVEKYIAEGEAKGLPTRQMVADMRALVDKYRSMSREDLLKHIMASPASIVLGK